ncbi:uncharacterized protein TNCV_1714131 [Trichonephila clavipes]|nr:uncharacterized protein TNCV_1714131 [Trichonephila clavipes]
MPTGTTSSDGKYPKVTAGQSSISILSDNTESISRDVNVDINEIADNNNIIVADNIGNGGSLRNVLEISSKAEINLGADYNVALLSVIVVTGKESSADSEKNEKDFDSNDTDRDPDYNTNINNSSSSEVTPDDSGRSPLPEGKMKVIFSSNKQNSSRKRKI